MSYTRPDYDSSDASWVGASVYTRPAFDSADASWFTAPSGEGTRHLFIGASQVAALRVGSAVASAAYLGSDVVWSD